MKAACSVRLSRPRCSASIPISTHSAATHVSTNSARRSRRKPTELSRRAKTAQRYPHAGLWKKRDLQFATGGSSGGVRFGSCNRGRAERYFASIQMNERNFFAELKRSEERRVGKEGRSRWA